MSTRIRSVGVLGIVALLVVACSGGGASTAPSAAAPSEAASVAPSTAPSEAAAEPVTVEWWNLQVNDPGKALLATLAQEYMAAHPNVTINSTVLENEALKTKIATAMQAGTPPDVFQSWGGGGLAEQAAAGLVKDITADVAPWADTMNAGAMGIYQIDGKQYGIPYNFGMVGFWYNKALFEQAGITATPTTWDELLAAVDTLKDGRHHPDRPGRQGQVARHVLVGLPVDAQRRSRCAQRGRLRRSLGRSALHRCRHATPGADRQGAVPGGLPGGDRTPTSQQPWANGKAAMELMGQWAPGRSGR